MRLTFRLKEVAGAFVKQRFSLKGYRVPHQINLKHFPEFLIKMLYFRPLILLFSRDSIWKKFFFVSKRTKL